MPIDNRFSKSSFMEEYQRDPSSRNLSDALEAEIQQEIHEVVMPKMLEIVERLNAMGHQLREYTPPIPGDISFRDEVQTAEGYVSLLRVGLDTVVSVGFRDAITEDG